MGIAFQIRDDLFDIMGTVDAIGKAIGFDVKKNMLTLPLIHMFEIVGDNKKKTLNEFGGYKNIISGEGKLSGPHGMEFRYLPEGFYFNFPDKKNPN